MKTKNDPILCTGIMKPVKRFEKNWLFGGSATKCWTTFDRSRSRCDIFHGILLYFYPYKLQSWQELKSRDTACEGIIGRMGYSKN
ncbi:hypothetical protein TNCT_210481 [Trichonephila clavata]|uniref:Uncharacterized protein n=1 Tax=Trichonephila clavata TaxID=2740835 RepID=A0A8X6HY96_TRICU|nr:hypothetical protein TNCT_210481 [Trichonephila clavata]